MKLTELSSKAKLKRMPAIICILLCLAFVFSSCAHPWRIAANPNTPVPTGTIDVPTDSAEPMNTYEIPLTDVPVDTDAPATEPLTEEPVPTESTEVPTQTDTEAPDTEIPTDGPTDIPATDSPTGEPATDQPTSAPTATPKPSDSIAPYTLHPSQKTSFCFYFGEVGFTR